MLDATQLQVNSVRYIIAIHATIPAARMERTQHGMTFFHDLEYRRNTL